MLTSVIIFFIIFIFLLFLSFEKKKKTQAHDFDLDLTVEHQPTKSSWSSINLESASLATKGMTLEEYLARR